MLFGMDRRQTDDRVRDPPRVDAEEGVTVSHVYAPPTETEHAEELVARVYELHSPEKIDAHYTKWAPSYDAELIENGFRSPRRCAEALAQFVAPHESVLDIGCGTGLSGQSLQAAGFTDVSGQDVNEAMADLARERSVYRELLVVDPDNPFPFDRGTFGAMSASGVISPGAAPPSVLTAALEALVPGAHLAFSFTDYAMSDPEYSAVLARVLAGGQVDEVFREYGPHIEGLGLGSDVLVLRRN